MALSQKDTTRQRIFINISILASKPVGSYTDITYPSNGYGGSTAVFIPIVRHSLGLIANGGLVNYTGSSIYNYITQVSYNTEYFTGGIFYAFILKRASFYSSVFGGMNYLNSSYVVNPQPPIYDPTRGFIYSTGQAGSNSPYTEQYQYNSYIYGIGETIKYTIKNFWR